MQSTTVSEKMEQKYYENYGYYKELVERGSQQVNVLDINKDNISNHILWIMNIFRDGIETEEVQSMCINVIFSDNYSIDLYISDYFFNLIHWSIIVCNDNTIYSKHVYFPENITNNYNKRYIDKWLHSENYGKINKILMNNIANDSLAYYRYINEFAFWLCNTLNLEDDIKLMKECKEAYDIMHSDLSDVPMEKLKDVAMDRASRLIEIIKDTDHYLSAMFTAEEGINIKQYRENCVNEGPKPNGDGSVFSIPINSNLLYLGALKDLAYAIIDYCSGRQAQIINKTNVGTSGSFGRLIKLNCMDTWLHEDPNYVCNTKNFVMIEVKNQEIARRLEGMTFRFNPEGLDYVFREHDYTLIGKTLYFRTAMTCASWSSGHGICHACYGQLAFMNSDINIGVIAAELFAEALTQKLLSAKHLLEAFIKALHWINQDLFESIFIIDCNEIMLNPNFNCTNYYLIIDLENDISDVENEDETSGFNHYITEIKIMDPKGNIISIGANTDPLSNDLTEFLYLTYETTKILKSKSKYNNINDDDVVKIPLSAFKDSSIFLMDIANTELSQTLSNLQKVINNAKKTSRYTKDEILQDFIECSIDSKLSITATHCAVILANQIRDAENILELPDWRNKDAEYQLLPLSKSLKQSPSIIKSLAYGYVNALLKDPISFKKSKPSEMDLYFLLQPQNYINPNYSTDSNKMIDAIRITDIEKFNKGLS